MKNKITRRALVKGGLLAGTLIPAFDLIGNSASAAADLTPLDPKDPAAITLGFLDDSTKVDAAANPRYAAGQRCDNCQQYLGHAGELRGGCVLFAGKSVPAAGWCKVWRKMP